MSKELQRNEGEEIIDLTDDERLARHSTNGVVPTPFLESSRLDGDAVVTELRRGPDHRLYQGVAVLLPCRNEQATIGKVVRDFADSLPGCTVYVYDNASTDGTAAEARNAGATVRHVKLPGKGNVLRQMFSQNQADIAVMADGDDTYDASAAPLLIRTLREQQLDMVVGRRVEASESDAAYRRGHRLGNVLLTNFVRRIFGEGFDDMLSGYRVLSNRFMKSFPATSRGFETETEMTVHALELSLPFDEVPTTYRQRPANSFSNLRTLPDGLKILRFIAVLCKTYRPLRFFGAAALATVLAAVGTFVGAGADIHTWAVSTVVAASLTALSVALAITGVILDSIGRAQRELKRMLYLAVGVERTNFDVSSITSSAVTGAAR